MNIQAGPPGVPILTTGYMQTICGTCRKAITLQFSHQINGMASCYYCYSDHQLSYNVCPCPFRMPRSRDLVDRSGQDKPGEKFFTRTVSGATNPNVFNKSYGEL